MENVKFDIKSMSSQKGEGLKDFFTLDDVEPETR
jgi:hypothetical protein